jgi:hypothetical protein
MEFLVGTAPSGYGNTDVDSVAAHQVHRFGPLAAGALFQLDSSVLNWDFASG